METARVPRVGFVAIRGGENVRARDGDVVFEAASIAKTIVGVAAMQLVERGAISLDEPISKWASFVPRPITMRQLLTHTSGLVDGAIVETRALPLEACVRAHLSFGDAGVRYSNVGFALAALVIERASGEPFEAYTRAHIFEPLGMTNTSWTGSVSHCVYPSVDLFSTANDLSHFARTILAGGEWLLSAESTQMMLVSQLGWQSRTFGTHVVVGHEGEDKSASTAMFLDRESGTAAIVLTNADTFTSADPKRIEAFARFTESLL